MARKVKGAQTPRDFPAQAQYNRTLSQLTIERGTARLKEIGKTRDPILTAEAGYWRAAIDHENAILTEQKAWGDDPHRTREKAANPKGWQVACETLDKTLPRVLAAFTGWQQYLKRQANPSMEVIELVQPIIADNLDALGMFNLNAKDKKFTSTDIAKTIAQVIAQEHISVNDQDMGIPPMCGDCDA